MTSVSEAIWCLNLFELRVAACELSSDTRFFAPPFSAAGLLFLDSSPVVDDVRDLDLLGLLACAAAVAVDLAEASLPLLALAAGFSTTASSAGSSSAGSA